MIWPELSEADLRAARSFREAQRELLAAKDPADITVSVFVRQVRHACAKLDGRSVNLELREHYVLSPQYAIYGSADEGWSVHPVSPEAMDVAADHVLLRAGQFGFIFTEGRCTACGMTARSGDSRLVDPRIRPPARGPRGAGRLRRLTDNGSVSDKDSRPGGMLELSPGLTRDLDRAAAGKIPAPPIEAFMSDAALTEAERQTSAASAPVHAEDLRPISRAEAATRTTFDGQVLPRMPARRRVIPAPFRRPSARGGGHGKTWQSARADQVNAGDMTELVGKVAEVVSGLRRETIAGRENVATGTDIILTGAGGVTATVDAASQVRVFRRS
jgi:hypothetical protein